MKRPYQPPTPTPRDLLDHLLGGADLLAQSLLTRRHPYPAISWDEALQRLDGHLGEPINVRRVLGEPALQHAEEHARRALAGVRDKDPFAQRWAADSMLAHLCYLACRAFRPEVVVETGVAYGVSAAFVLAALRENGDGALYSVELPPLRRGAERSWGVAVPEELRGRWTVHRGASARVLPDLLEGLGRVDLFVHDSLHTARNMRREFGLVWPRLRPGGALIADDVERNAAFGELREKGPALWLVVGDRERRPLHGKAAPVTFGVAVK